MTAPPTCGKDAPNSRHRPGTVPPRAWLTNSALAALLLLLLHSTSILFSVVQNCQIQWAPVCGLAAPLALLLLLLPPQTSPGFPIKARAP